MVRNVMKHTLHKLGVNKLSIHEGIRHPFCRPNQKNENFHEKIMCLEQSEMKNKHNFFSFGGHKLLQKYTKMPPKSVKNCLKSSQNCPKSTTNGKCAKMTKLKLILCTYGRPISQEAYACKHMHKLDDPPNMVDLINYRVNVIYLQL